MAYDDDIVKKRTNSVINAGIMGSIPGVGFERGAPKENRGGRTVLPSVAHQQGITPGVPANVENKSLFDNSPVDRVIAPFRAVSNYFGEASDRLANFDRSDMTGLGKFSMGAASVGAGALSNLYGSPVAAVDSGVRGLFFKPDEQIAAEKVAAEKKPVNPAVAASPVKPVAAKQPDNAASSGLGGRPAGSVEVIPWHGQEKYYQTQDGRNVMADGSDASPYLRHLDVLNAVKGGDERGAAVLAESERSRLGYDSSILENLASERDRVLSQGIDMENLRLKQQDARFRDLNVLDERGESQKVTMRDGKAMSNKQIAFDEAMAANEKDERVEHVIEIYATDPEASDESVRDAMLKAYPNAPIHSAFALKKMKDWAKMGL